MRIALGTNIRLISHNDYNIREPNTSSSHAIYFMETRTTEMEMECISRLKK